jgi:hypothetical protein
MMTIWSQQLGHACLVDCWSLVWGLASSRALVGFMDGILALEAEPLEPCLGTKCLANCPGFL